MLVFKDFSVSFPVHPLKEIGIYELWNTLLSDVFAQIYMKLRNIGNLWGTLQCCFYHGIILIGYKDIHKKFKLLWPQVEKRTQGN